MLKQQRVPGNGAPEVNRMNGQQLPIQAINPRKVSNVSHYSA